MYVKDVTVQNQVGLHARPATFFIQKANEFKSSIWVEKEERRVNAKSLLGVLSLGIVGGTKIRIIADGADEDRCRQPREARGIRLFRIIDRLLPHGRSGENRGGFLLWKKACAAPSDSALTTASSNLYWHII